MFGALRYISDQIKMEKIQRDAPRSAVQKQKELMESLDPRYLEERGGQPYHMVWFAMR